ncbi:DUF4878 domain-containing protein [Flavihumibacter rivuli]|uniref:DUF4878 domain-containing protein n=1 Tax=Flavihumibacter rivuli TaxID=2838156 RepID=UPI001BDE32A1|nr:DUF4878 domain-containing protein [Flavihumibacter rivuli]ULQ57372.1 DUF4878 domain-containing protein [Flavihumibacter rivuli]
MKRLFLSLLIGGALLAMTACSGEASFKKAEDAQDAGREFIRASLDGNMKKAEFYLLKDSTNTMLFNKWKNDFYNKLSTEERMNYQQANILPTEIVNVNDSTVSFSYTNTYKNKDTTTVRIVRVNGEWLVDFKDVH